MSIRNLLNDALTEEYLSSIPGIKPNLFQGSLGTDGYYQSIHYGSPGTKLSSIDGVRTSLAARLQRLGMVPKSPVDPDEMLFSRLLVPESHNESIEALKRMFSSFLRSNVDLDPSLVDPISTKEFLDHVKPEKGNIRSIKQTIPGVHTTLLTSRDGKHVFHQSLPSGRPLSKSDLMAEDSGRLARNVQELLSRINRANYVEDVVYDFNPDEFDATDATTSIWVDQLDRVYACGTTVLIPGSANQRTQQKRIEANHRVFDEIGDLTA